MDDEVVGDGASSFLKDVDSWLMPHRTRSNECRCTKLSVCASLMLVLVPVVLVVNAAAQCPRPFPFFTPVSSSFVAVTFSTPLAVGLNRRRSARFDLFHFSFGRTRLTIAAWPTKLPIPAILDRSRADITSALASLGNRAFSRLEHAHIVIWTLISVSI